MSTEAQDSKESAPVGGEASKETVRSALSQLEQEYAALTSNKDIATWKQLEQKFKDHESLKTNEHLSTFEQAELARKEAYIAYHILELKYEPQMSILGYPTSEELKSTSAAERKVDYHSAVNVIRLYEEALKAFESARIPSESGSYQKAARGREASVLMGKMFEAFENGVQNERVRIQTDVSDFLNKSLSLSPTDEVVVKVSPDGTEAEITVMKNDQDISILEISLDYSNSNFAYVQAIARYYRGGTGVFLQGGLDGQQFILDNVIQVINGQNAQYPRVKKQ